MLSLRILLLASLLLLAGPLTGAALAQIVVFTTPQGQLTPVGSVDVEGLVIDVSGSGPYDKVFFRTRYPGGSMNAPVNSRGAYDPTSIGWEYVVDWDPITSTGTFKGRGKWLKAGQNFIDIYLDGGELGNPGATLQVNYQFDAVSVTEIVLGYHPRQRTIDLVDVSGNAGVLEFSIDLINTTTSQSLDVDLVGEVLLPDGSLVLLPMGGPGTPVASYSIDPGDFSATSFLDPAGLTFSFPLDQVPFPATVQEGVYSLTLRAMNGLLTIDEEDDIDFWVTDRSAKPFRDVTSVAGLDQVLLQGGNLPSAGNGITPFDFNDDGLVDLFFANPSGERTFLPVGPSVKVPGAPNYLMRNNGDGTFSDVAEVAGVQGDFANSTYGAAWGDFNKDGFNDLFVANRRDPNNMFKNNGDETFTDVSFTSFGGPTLVWHHVPKPGDPDEDGDLDLYIGAYMDQFSTTWQNTGYANLYYRNELAEGLFEVIDPSWPLFTKDLSGMTANSEGLTLAAFFADMDRDGNLDVVVHNDFGHFGIGNELYLGDGTGQFTDATVSSGYGVKEFSMGAAAADFDGDGLLDTYSSNIGQNSYLLNNGNGTFTQAVIGSGAEADYMIGGPQADGVFLDDNWGIMAWDFDLDQDMDMYVAGSDLFTTFNMPIAELNPDSVFENDGTGHFTRAEAALGLENTARTRSSIQIDYDGDGDMDVVSSAENEGVTLMRNDLDNGNNWLRVRPVTYHTAPGGFNTLFRITTADRAQVHELSAESSHSSHTDNRFQFGLGVNGSAEVVAEWQRGGSTTYFSVSANQEFDVHESKILFEGEIDGSVPAGVTLDAKLYGQPGMFAVAGIADPSFSVGIPLPTGGSMDITPYSSTPLFYTHQFGPSGVAGWPLGAAGFGAIGKTFEAQMAILDPVSGIYIAKSGISSITVTP